MADALESPRKTRKPGRKRSEAAEERLLTLAENRVAIEAVEPEIDGGRFPVKRVQGEPLVVEADVFSDGHDKIAAAVVYGAEDARTWHETPLIFVENDRWSAEIVFDEAGPVSLLGHRLARPPRDVARRGEEEARRRQADRSGTDRGRANWCARPRDPVAAPRPSRTAIARLHEKLESCTRKATPTASIICCRIRRRSRCSPSPASAPTCRAIRATSRSGSIAPQRASPPGTSCSRARSPAIADRHGTFDDVIDRLPDIQDMGFDVLYFPPIHPIGTANRKGRNNTLTPSPSDPGSPYAIGSPEGGHDAIHPELGNFEDFARLISAGARPRARDRHRLRHPVLARPSLDQGASGMVRLAARTERSNSPRTRRRGTRTSSTSTSTAARCRRSGTPCATSSCSGWTRACGSSASTIRTPSRSRSGNG